MRSTPIQTRESNTSTGVNINWVQALKNSENPLKVFWRNLDSIVLYPQPDFRFWLRGLVVGNW